MKISDDESIVARATRYGYFRLCGYLSAAARLAGFDLLTTFPGADAPGFMLSPPSAAGLNAFKVHKEFFFVSIIVLCVCCIDPGSETWAGALSKETG